MKPLAFIDIDGVLNRIVSNRVAREMGYESKHFWGQGQRFKLHLDREDKQRLDALAEHFELAWGTTWEIEAEPIGRFLGQPMYDRVAITHYHERSKAPGVLRAANGRPFVWLDDVHSNHLADLANAQQSYLLVDVEPSIGLTWSHVEQCIDWADLIENT